jgi:hypothetical protein
MAEVKKPKYYLYAELPSEYGEFLDKMKELGLDKNDVVRLAFDVLMSMDIEEFFKVSLIPKAQAIDLTKFFKGKKQEVK